MGAQAHGQYAGAGAAASASSHAQTQGSGYGQPQGGLNSIDYAGQYTENRPAYAQNPNAPVPAARQEDEDTTGPPKGFFYSFDYPVGIIVNKQGPVAKQASGEAGRY